MRSGRAAGTLLAPALAALLLAGCDAVRLRQAVFLERSGRSAEALKIYRDFLWSRPAHPRRAEILVRAAGVYGELGLCDEARPLYEEAARSPGAPPWREKALLGLLECPDYFPMSAGRTWTYVDSQSGGRHMRLSVSVQPSSAPGRALWRETYYAGNVPVRKVERLYAKEAWGLWESDGKDRWPALHYPFRAGTRWEALRGRRVFSYAIEEDGLTVRTRAGVFSGCLKVREQAAGPAGVKPAGAQAWVYLYYCPGVGRVKTTVGVPGRENPNTELAAFLSPS